MMKSYSEWAVQPELEPANMQTSPLFTRPFRLGIVFHYGIAIGVYKAFGGPCSCI